MQRRFCYLAMLAGALACPTVADAHFQVLLPQSDVLDRNAGSVAELTILFTHPMENGPVMPMGKPRQFGVLAGGKRTDLLEQLRPVARQGQPSYSASVRMTRPGDHVFYLEPAPYYEAAEEKLIVHYTKVVVNHRGVEKGWDASVGFPIEIEPLTRPYGLWTGNTFRGVVRRHGKPVPGAIVEVEYYNESARVAVPNDALATQVIKTDAAGTFSYSMPQSGWWGFAALVDGDEKAKAPDGKMVDVEWGGVLWVRTVPMQARPDAPRSNADAH